MKEGNRVWNQKGISLIEVLASVVLVSLIFSIFSSYILASVQNTRTISNKYTAVQIADSLMNVYLKQDYEELLPMAGYTTNVDLVNLLGISEKDMFGFKATLTVERHPNPELKGRVLLLRVDVRSSENGAQRRSSIRGYKRR